MRLNPNLSAADAIVGIESIYKKYNSADPFDFRFASDQHNLKFRREDQIVKLSLVFSSLAIFISCMGIFGLASFMAEQRTKEIGVRKVLGATLFNLCQLLSIDFIILVLISFLVAVPSAYYLMHNWLMHYEYHTEISGRIFLVTGIGALLITLLTVSFHAIKAALMNPVNSLRSE
jgi:ABC-type antimicrobial peptide transport system permease subunit